MSSTKVMDYTILPAMQQHLPHLPGIEDAAGETFPLDDLPEPLRSIGLSPEDFERAADERLLWVVVDGSRTPSTPIAFLMARVIDGCMHIGELDVHPDHGRRGVGSRLLSHVLAVAGRRGFGAVTLTTFEHLPWNGPFYARHGFVPLRADEVGIELAQIVEKERALGMRRRVAMKFDLTRSAA